MRRSTPSTPDDRLQYPGLLDDRPERLGPALQLAQRLGYAAQGWINYQIPRTSRCRRLATAYWLTVVACGVSQNI